MTASEPEGRDPHGGPFAPLGIFLIVSGIVVILVAAFANPLVAAAGPFLIASGIGLVVASEYRDEAEMKYDRLLGLRLWTKKRSDPAAEDQEPAQPRPARESGERAALEVIDGQGKAGGHRNRDPTRRASGCRFAQALGKRWDGDR
ncbi:MAG TPA: DUF308 domain-containing protein [Solirubrobacterales bacterium]|nr:DUF308 domain-containing protein [Solirubrobacterales bacterium]